MNQKETEKLRAKIRKIYGGILLFGLIYFLWIKITNAAIPCFYFVTTGYLCPGCGITRMFLSLAKLEFSKAFFYHPPAFCLFFLWNLIAALCYWGRISFVKQEHFLYGIFALSMIVLICFGVVRNLY